MSIHYEELNQAELVSSVTTRIGSRSCNISAWDETFFLYLRTHFVVWSWAYFLISNIYLIGPIEKACEAHDRLC
jgi:hypothetical protein